MEPTLRGRVRFLAAWGSAVAALMLILSVVGVVVAAKAAGTPAGTVQVITPHTSGGTRLDGGGSSTQFTLKLPTNASCPGDSSNDQYKVQTYMVSDAIDPATLQFGSAGPTGSSAGNHATFKQPMYTPSGSPIANRQTQDKTPTNPRGVILEQEAMWFGVYQPGDIPPGTYNIGVACTLGGASATQMKEFWNNKIAFTTNDADSPAKVAWTVPSNEAPTSGTGTTTTSTSTTSTTTTSSTSTTLPTSTTSSTTSTTVAPTTTSTTVAPTTTTSTTVAPTSTTAGVTTTTAAPQSITLSASSGNRGASITVQGGGYAPGTSAQVYFLSDPVLLATTTVDGSGVARATVTIPTNAAEGQHTIELRGTAHGGSPRVLSASFIVGGALPRTGSAVTPIFVWGALFVVLGGVAVRLGRPTPLRHGLKR